jgi:hypothetical protein
MRAPARPASSRVSSHEVDSALAADDHAAHAARRLVA